MIFSTFASLCSPAPTMWSHAPSPLSATPLSSFSHVLSTTALSFDPMEIDSITMPQGTKHKLDQLYQSMGELPRKRPKTEPVFMNKELLAATEFETKKHLRKWFNTLVAVPEYKARASLLASETSMKSLFFRRKNNSFSFDFVVLASNSEPTSSSFAKSPSHDLNMYVFKANSKQVFAGESIKVSTPSAAPLSAPALTTPLVPSSPSPAAAPAPSSSSPAAVPAPSSGSQDAAMDDTNRPAAESAELPLSHPSRLGKSILCRKKDPIDSWAYVLGSALKDVERSVRTGRKPDTVYNRSKPMGITKKSKTKGARHQPLTASEALAAQEQVKDRNRMPFDEEESEDDDDKDTGTPT